MLVAMVGLPGAGKSALAARLAARLGGVVLSKDVVRSALFPGPALDYSAEQDELTMRAVFAAVAYLKRARPALPVFLDGRTYSKAHQVAALLALGEDVGAPVRVIECVCPPEVAKARIARDHTAGSHPAGNRTPDLHDRSRAAADPLTIPRLTLDTAALGLEECEATALRYLGSGLP